MLKDVLVGLDGIGIKGLFCQINKSVYKLIVKDEENDEISDGISCTVGAQPSV